MAALTAGRNMDNGKKQKAESVIQTVLAIIKSRENLKEDAVVLLADLSAVAVAVKNAAASLSGSASEISGAITRVVDDVRHGTGASAVVVDVDNYAEDAFEHEWREARKQRAAKS